MPETRVSGASRAEGSAYVRDVFELDVDDSIRKQVRAPGIEPGFKAWKALVITPRPHPLGDGKYEVEGDMQGGILSLAVIGNKG
jgi:hypothetical protein